jgi:hypothetical protein
LVRGREEHDVAWNIELVDDCAVVVMNTNEVNVQNDGFFADLQQIVRVFPMQHGTTQRALR